MSEINVDAELVNTSEVLRADEQLVEMTNGCICCTLREDLVVEVARLAAEGEFDSIVIESTGISEPMPVATTFAFRDEDGFSLGDVADLDTMVTVVDAQTILRELGTRDRLTDRDIGAVEDDERRIAHLLIDQIEFANVIIVNKTDRAGRSELKIVEGIIEHLNPGAKLLRARYADVSLDAVLDTGAYEVETASRSAGWSASWKGSTRRRLRSTALRASCIAAGCRSIRNGWLTSSSRACRTWFGRRARAGLRAGLCHWRVVAGWAGTDD